MMLCASAGPKDSAIVNKKKTQGKSHFQRFSATRQFQTLHRINREWGRRLYIELLEKTPKETGCHPQLLSKLTDSWKWSPADRTLVLYVVITAGRKTPTMLNTIPLLQSIQTEHTEKVVKMCSKPAVKFRWPTNMFSVLRSYIFWNDFCFIMS